MLTREKFHLNKVQSKLNKTTGNLERPKKHYSACEQRYLAFVQQALTRVDTLDLAVSHLNTKQKVISFVIIRHSYSLFVKDRSSHPSGTGPS